MGLFSKEKIKKKDAGVVLWGSMLIDLIPHSNILKYDLCEFGAVREEVIYICTAYSFGIATIYLKESLSEAEMDEIFVQGFEELNNNLNGAITNMFQKLNDCYQHAKFYMLHYPIETGDEVFPNSFIDIYLINLLNNKEYPKELVDIAKQDLNAYLRSSNSFFKKSKIVK